MKLSDYEQMPPVAALMTPFPHFVPPSAPLADVLQLMQAHQIRHVPVTQSGAVVGMVSRASILAALKTTASADSSRCVADLQLLPPCTVEFTDPLSEALRELADQHAGSAIVLKSGKLAGVVTSTDICSALAEFLEDRFGLPPDAA
jgi:acetoin utilization protein AcuB